MSEPVNKEAVLLYLDGARDAINTARFNLENDFYGVAINRAYYAFFYTATALLLTLDMTRSKHSGVMAAFHENFVKSGLFSVEVSRVYGEAFELRNTTDYEMLGKADAAQAQIAVENAKYFVEFTEDFLRGKDYL